MEVNPVIRCGLTVSELTRFHFSNQDRSCVNESLDRDCVDGPWRVKAIECAITVAGFYAGYIVNIFDSGSHTSEWFLGGLGVVKS